MVLIVLILYFLTHLTATIQWFNFRLNEQPKYLSYSSNTRHPNFHFQQFAHEQQIHAHSFNISNRPVIVASNKKPINRSLLQTFTNQAKYRFNNTDFVHYQTDNINKKSDQRTSYQQEQHQYLNKLESFHSNDRVINNTHKRNIHPKFLFFFPIAKRTTTVVNRRVFPQIPLLKLIAADSKRNNSSIIKNKIQSFRTRSVLEKAIMKSTKQNLLRAFTTKATNNNRLQYRQLILDDFNNQQQLKEFQQNENEKNATYIHSNINLVLKKRKPRNQENDDSLDIFHNMIFVRDAPVNQENVDWD
ncbi:unnamed protein product [Rotaria sp. Silwood2]|nr:unnamed protein product [Rotaria sp. Silwood2]CAF4337640.1 unnamed protein product [Rotaria sp. Silwood2]